MAQWYPSGATPRAVEIAVQDPRRRPSERGGSRFPSQRHGPGFYRKQPPPAMQARSPYGSVDRFNRAGNVAVGEYCDVRPPPPIQMGPDGCPQGYLQCKQPIAADALAVAASGTATIVVTPRRAAVARQWIISAASALTFTIDELQVDGTLLNVNVVTAEAWSAAANGVDYSVDWPPFDSNTPMNIVVTNLDAMAAQDFRSVVFATVNRGA